MDRPVVFKDTAKVPMNRHHIFVKKQTSDLNIVVPFLGVEISISMDRPTEIGGELLVGFLIQHSSTLEAIDCRMVRKLACGLVLIACGLILLKKTDGGVVLIFRTNYSDVNVGITYVGTAVAKGAVCLDGSPPAYHLDKGFGAGRNKWLVHHEGGGWCSNMSTCLSRKDTRLGSSKKMEKLLPFIGILSSQRKFNPDFYNWNRVLVRYCDGASFTGDVEEVDPDTNLHFRGSRVFVAVMEELLAKGMKTAQDALLTGCSAGGLTVTLHCDQFRALLPRATKVKCVTDAAYFVNVKDISGARHIETYYNDVVKTHGSANNLPPSCTSKRKPGLCFFQQNMAKLVETPLFVVNSAYDSWQIPNVLAPDTADPDGRWHDCKFNLTKCSTDQLKTIQDFRLMFLDALKELGSSSSRGIFIDSCYEHDQITVQETWLSDDSPALDGTKLAKAVGDWYNDKYPFQKIDDCSYPCKNCPSFKHTL
ncbi:hypothetical protein RHGRI_038174 [Rhododendron griersonianum]|uniref:Pectin acetylesterase n=1 Tax=Rhododendron griersonianum TaxID=479676 RepID=A0AAV6HXZ9_9ERIC|nr:hypothetical protein RHGRI_038174 [Rhododendron griersonianum]